MNFLMAVLIGIRLKNLLNTSSLKQKFIKQNKQLFGNEIYLDQFSSTNNQKKVKIHDSWYNKLQNEFEKNYWKNLSSKVKNFYKNRVIYPKPNLMFNAFNSTKLDEVKVVIIGQDPYHGPSQAHGLSFSVSLKTPTPPSLKNIYKEMGMDLGLPEPDHGNLESWARQGVLMLNSCLTVEHGKAGSHANKGWEQFTDSVIGNLNVSRKNLVFILFYQELH